LNTRKYEALYIVAPQLTDAEVQTIADKYKTLVETHEGSVESAGKWEKRKLAYEIEGHKEGNYIMMHFEAPANLPAELNRQMRNNDEVIRHRIYLREDGA
jgi:small subunit ribosomal protein S6